MSDDSTRQAGELTDEVTQEMIERVLDVLRESGLCDEVSPFEAPLARRICRIVLLAARSGN